MISQAVPNTALLDGRYAQKKEDKKCNAYAVRGVIFSLHVS